VHKENRLNGVQRLARTLDDLWRNPPKARLNGSYVAARRWADRKYFNHCVGSILVGWIIAH
jgi:hypothetical protein